MEFGCEHDDTRQKLKEFIRLNYKNYYGIMIFHPTKNIDSDLMHQAGMMWLQKNGITL